MLLGCRNFLRQTLSSNLLAKVLSKSLHLQMAKLSSIWFGAIWTSDINQSLFSSRTPKKKNNKSIKCVWKISSLWTTALRIKGYRLSMMLLRMMDLGRQCANLGWKLQRKKDVEKKVPERGTALETQPSWFLFSSVYFFLFQFHKKKYSGGRGWWGKDRET